VGGPLHGALLGKAAPVQHVDVGDLVRSADGIVKIPVDAQADPTVVSHREAVRPASQAGVGPLGGPGQSMEDGDRCLFARKHPGPVVGLAMVAGNPGGE